MLHEPLNEAKSCCMELSVCFKIAFVLLFDSDVIIFCSIILLYLGQINNYLCKNVGSTSKTTIYHLLR